MLDRLFQNKIYTYWEIKSRFLNQLLDEYNKELNHISSVGCQIKSSSLTLNKGEEKNILLFFVASIFIVVLDSVIIMLM